FIIFIIIISIIIFNLNKFSSIIKKINSEKKNPFECGFNPISIFYAFFFLVRLLFLIFDITLLIPIIFYLKYLNFYYIINIILLFMFIILFTLILE
ncbi:hypothetical protein E2986_12462, partial [Frieseomelitta varia]